MVRLELQIVKYQCLKDPKTENFFEVALLITFQRMRPL